MSHPVSHRSLPIFAWQNRSFQTDSQHHSERELNRLTCSVCWNIMNKPVAVCEDKHLFCTQCAENWQKEQKNSCPQCRKPMVNFQIDVTQDRAIKGLSVICSNNDCTYSHEISEIESHIQQCEHELVPCAGECGEPPIKRKKMNDHKAICTKHFKCACGELMPDNPSPKYSELFKKHIAADPSNHRALHFLLRCQARESCERPPLAPQTAGVSKVISPPAIDEEGEHVTFAGIPSAPVSGEHGVYKALGYPGTFFVLFDIPRVHEGGLTSKTIPLTYQDEFGSDKQTPLTLKCEKIGVDTGSLDFYCDPNKDLSKVYYTVYTGLEQRKLGSDTMNMDGPKRVCYRRGFNNVRTRHDAKYLIKVYIPDCR